MISAFRKDVLPDFERGRLVPDGADPVRVQDPGSGAAVALRVILVDGVQVDVRLTADDDEGVAVGSAVRPRERHG